VSLVVAPRRGLLARWWERRVVLPESPPLPEPTEFRQ